MTECLTVHIVTEHAIDYDDYPVGQGDVVLVTADVERAEALARWPYPSIEGRSRHGRISRSMRSFVVEDVPSDKGTEVGR